MGIDSRFLDELKDRHTLSDVVARKVRLVRRGREHTGLCPFHKEKTPSFTVNDDKGFYHCFGCGAHGSVLDFVMNTEGLAFRDAVEQLAGNVGMTVPKPSPEAAQKAEERKSLSTIMEQVASWFSAQLLTGSGTEARKYLTERGVLDATIEKYQIGFAPQQRTSLKDAMQARNISEADLIELGMLIKPDDGGPSYDRFRNRIIFPIQDRQGRVIAFGGRAMERDAKAKYLNSPETSLFKKGQTLYNWHRARPAAFNAGNLIVVEGYMDVIALGDAGLDQAVAPLGTALTEEQLAHLWQMTDEPVLAFDGDNAGLRAAARAAERALPILRAGKSLRFLFLPQGDDPDTLVRREGTAAFERLIAGAAPLVDHLWQLYTQGVRDDTPERRAGLEKKIFSELSRIGDENVKNLYQREFRNRLFERGRARPRGKRQSAAKHGQGGGLGRTLLGRQKGQAPVIDSLEKALMLTTVHHPEILVRYTEDIAALEFSSPAMRKLRDALIEWSAGTETLDADGLETHLNSLGLDDTLTSLRRDLPRKANWSAWPEAALSDALTFFEHVLARFRFATEARRDYEQARAEYEADVNENNHARFMAAQKAFQELEEKHAVIEGYGLESNKFRDR